jgi:lipid A ethanolaminephosphotransferase
MWFGEKFKVNKVALKQRASQPYSQDFIFDTLLGMGEVKTSVYRSELDILHGIH